MSQENVEMVRRVFEAFKAGMERGDPGAVFDTDALVADAEWIPIPEFPGAAVYRGREGFVEFMRTWTEDFEDWSFRLERLIDAGNDRVVGLFHQWAIGKGSGVPVELHLATVWELEGGRVVRLRNYVDPAQALEAAGLEE
jgi:ketosteroid isomerase-like protein